MDAGKESGVQMDEGLRSDVHVAVDRKRGVHNFVHTAMLSALYGSHCWHQPPLQTRLRPESLS